ncbi:MAG: hypothetical protein SWK90_11915 [Chloroflexota bacterium]|nr:hypothetical protein [Chloroflexota bacterium]
MIELNGAATSHDRILELAPRSPYLCIYAHGSPNGFHLVGEALEGSDPMPPLGPIVVVAEACESGNIANDVENSIVLRFVHSGAVAYVGSMEVGGVLALGGARSHLYSSPRMPLGELTRLQTLGRLDLDATWPRVILIGEPLFALLPDEPATLHLEATGDGWCGTLTVHSPHTDVPALHIPLPGSPPVRYAEARAEERVVRRYYCGYMPSDDSNAADVLIVAPSDEGQTVLIDWPAGADEICLYTRLPAGAGLHRFGSLVCCGISVILGDILSNTTGPAQMFLGLAAILAAAALLSHIKSDRRNLLVVGLTGGIPVSLLSFWYSRSTVYPALVLGCYAFSALVFGSSARRWLTRWGRTLAIFAAQLFPLLLFSLAVGVSGKVIEMLALGSTALVLLFATIAAPLSYLSLHIAPISPFCSTPPV